MLAIVTALTIALISERVLYACVCLLFFLFGLGPDRKSTWFVAFFVQNAVGFFGGVLTSLARLFAVGIRTALWCLVIVVLWWALYYAGQHSGPALIMFQRVYNSDVGGVVRMAVVVPTQMLQMVWDAVVPLWNVVWYCIKTIPVRVMLENVLGLEGFADVKECVKHLANFVMQIIASLIDYVQIIVNPPDSFAADLRLLDLMTPLASWRLAVSSVLAWTGRMCSVASSVVDIAMYPFLDINFGLGLHNLINSVLHLIIHVPATTVERCKAGGGVTVYCLPDFEPVFELLVEGVRNVGCLIDNWLDIVMVIVQSVLTNTSPACDAGMAVVDIAARSSSIMGVNETTIVGMASSVFALTDGWNVQVFERTERRSYPDAFPFPVRVDYGIAKVSASVDVAGLMGCSCTDRAYGMQLLCAVAPLDPLETSYVVPVEFAVPTTSFYMACSRAKIKVETIRKPVTRFTSNSQSSTQSPVAEAAIWVTPMCSSEVIDIACIDTFKLAGCFPYCMALWTKGYSGSLVLRSANEWWTTVAMVSRDCGLHTWDLADGELKEVTSKLLQTTGVTSPWANVEVQLNSSRCVYSANMYSRMDKSTAASAYSEHRSIRLNDQPFAFAADLVFTAVETTAGNWGIEVHRIWGNQVVQEIRAAIVRFNSFISSSESNGLHSFAISRRCLSSTRDCRLRVCSSSAFCCSNCRRAFRISMDSIVVAVNSLDGISKYSVRTPATVRLVFMSTIRLGRTMSSWIAFPKLMSFFPPDVNREAVAGLAAARASVCDALFRLFIVSTENRSSANMQLLSSITRTERPTESNLILRNSGI
jgi:hypothetical protein